LDKETAEIVHWLNELKRRRPELAPSMHRLCVNHGVESLAELARVDLPCLEMFYDGMWGLEEEVGDADPSAPNLPT
jgi:hypothetical protein